MTNVIVMVVALTIYAESRGEGKDGMDAVASVVWTRAKADPWRLKDVCLAPHQFSCWQIDSDGKAILESSVVATDESLTYAKRLAQQMVGGTFKPSIDATHFYSTKIMRQAPYWASSMAEVTQIGNHKFFKETT